MTSHRLAIIAFAALAVAGCRTRPEQRAVMDSYQEELRRYENIIYDLEYNNETLCLENERLKQRLETNRPQRADEGPSLFSPRSEPRGGLRPGDDRPKASLPDDTDLAPPLIESDPEPDLPPMTSTSTIKKPVTSDDVTPVEEDSPQEPVVDLEAPDEAPSVPQSILVTPKANQKTRPREPAPAEDLPAPMNPRSGTPELLPEPEDKKVSQLYIDPRHTRGVDLDRQTGDDGLRVVIEPRNVAGQFVPAGGNVSVVLLDPSQPGEAARLGRWEFEPDYVQHQLRLTGKRNIPLELPWTNQKPQSARLTLFVRLETANGEQIEAHRDVTILLPGQISSRWTPRPAERRGPLKPQVEVARSEPEPEVAPASHVEPDNTAKAATTAKTGRPEWKPYR